MTDFQHAFRISMSFANLLHLSRDHINLQNLPKRISGNKSSHFRKLEDCLGQINATFINKFYWKEAAQIIEVNLGLQIRQMRYQSKPYRSLSYAERDSLNFRELRENKENKQNNNCMNVPASKPLRGKDNEPYLLGKLKLEHKISENTTHTNTSSITSRDSFPQQLKRTYSQLIRKDYSDDILSHLCATAETQQGILSSHSISASLRSKMVDWMIEVLSSYKMTEETFFRSIYFMDAFLKNTEEKLEVKDLHLIGVTSMFSAAKYEEIHPLKLSVIYEKIARKKFRKSEILERESDIMNVLNFKLESPSIYDISRHIVEQLKMNLRETSSKYFKKIILYLSKMVLFNFDLAEEDPTLMAGAVVFIALKTLEQVDSTAEPEGKVKHICELLHLDQETMIETSRKVLQLAKNFSKYYPNLTNLKKFNKFEYGMD